MTRTRIALALVAASLGAGCGDSGGSTTPSADAGADAAVVLPEQPAPPMPPVLTPCAAGWREAPTTDGPTTCEPWPESGHAECSAIDEAHFPGTPGCSRIGLACPTGDFPEGLPAGTPVRYVLATAAPGGDGSIDRPFATITEALVGVPAGSIVAVGKGSYDEAFNVPGRVTIWGACVAQTLLHASTPGALRSTPVVGFLRAGGALRNVRIGAGPRQAVFLDGRLASATVDGVLVDGGSSMGIGANAGHLVLHDVVVRDRGSRGLEVVEGATVEATRLVIERVHDVGVYAGFDGTLRLEDSAVRSVLPSATGAAGIGIALESHGTVDASRVVVEDVRNAGIVALIGSAVTVTDSVVRDVADQASDGEYGIGLWFDSDSTATVSRVLVERAADAGLLAKGPGSIVTVSDVVVRDMLGHARTPSFGRGISAQTGAALSVERAWIVRAREIGVFVATADAQVTFTDLTVRDTAPNGNGEGGRGLSVQEPGTSVEVVRSELVRSREIAVAVHEGSTLRLTDVAVRETSSREVDGIGGYGIVSNGGHLEGARILIERTPAVGTVAVGPSASIRYSQLTVRDTMPRDCTGTSCTDAAYGVGVAVDLGAAVSADGFAILRATICGALVTDGSSMDLAHGQVRGCGIGMCIQSDGYDTSRLAVDVLYADNGRTLDTLSLPLPDALAPL